MRKSHTAILAAFLALPVLWASGTPQQKALPRKRPDAPSPSKLVEATTKPAEQSAKRAYAALTISELVREDPTRWTEGMATHVTVGGFVTSVTKEKEGDVSMRLCENPKVEGMDRARCIEAKCIPKLPCEMPQIGKPITVSGITRYVASAGTHWWEIDPVEQVEK